MSVTQTEIVEVAELAEYTAKDVAMHQSNDDLWIIIHGEVFNVSSYLHDHPGGADLFTEIAGADGSEAFDNAQHSEDALSLKEGFRVGRIKGYENEKKTTKKAVRVIPATAPSSSTSAKLEVIMPALSAVVGIPIVCFGVWWCATRVAALPNLRNISAKSLWRDPADMGFTEGVLLTSTVFASSVYYFVVRRFQATMHLWTGQWRYENHLKLPKMVRPDISSRRGWLDPTVFQKLPLAKKITLAPNTFKLVFNLPKPNMALGLPVGQHVSIRGLVDGKQVQRSYTPISSNADSGILELVIRCYEKGVLTNGYIKSLEVGDEVEFRGPKGGIRYRRGLATKIGMVAGGTGITPMYQLIRAICEDPRDTTEISLIYANRSENDILLREELGKFAFNYPRNFSIFYVLDQAPDGWTGGRGFVTQQMMQDRFAGPSPTSKVALCGPLPMVESAKRSLGQLGFALPGAIAKPSDEILCF